MPVFRIALIRQNHWFVCQCLDVDIASQGGSQEEALANIKEALALYFETPSSFAGCHPGQTIYVEEPYYSLFVEVEIVY